MRIKKGLGRWFRRAVPRMNLFRFELRRILLGFEYANIFLQRVDKRSLEMILRKHGAVIGTNCDLESGLVFHNCRDYSHLRIGDNCHIGKQCFFDLRGPVLIEDDVVVSMRCNFITHIDMEKSPLANYYPSETGAVRIRAKAYLGVNTTVLKGVTVGQGTLIGAHSLVRSSTPDYVVMGGVPARVLKEVGKSVQSSSND